MGLSLFSSPFSFLASFFTLPSFWRWSSRGGLFWLVFGRRFTLAVAPAGFLPSLPALSAPAVFLVSAFGPSLVGRSSARTHARFAAVRSISPDLFLAAYPPFIFASADYRFLIAVICYVSCRRIRCVFALIFCDHVRASVRS